MKFNIKQFVEECSFELIASGIIFTMCVALIFWALVFREFEGAL